MTGRLRMQVAFLFVVAQILVTLSSAFADEVDEDWLSTQDILMTSNDYLFMMPDCLEARTANELWKIRAGSDELFAEAERKAAELLAKIRERRFEELDLDLVW